MSECSDTGRTVMWAGNLACTYLILAPSLKPISPGFSASKSKSALQQGTFCTGDETLKYKHILATLYSFSYITCRTRAGYHSDRRS